MTRVDTTTNTTTQYETQGANNQQGVDPSSGRTVSETPPMTKKEFTKQFFKLLFTFRYKKLHNLCKQYKADKHRIIKTNNTISPEEQSKMQDLNKTIGKPAPTQSTQSAPQANTTGIPGAGLPPPPGMPGVPPPPPPPPAMSGAPIQTPQSTPQSNSTEMPAGGIPPPPSPAMPGASASTQAAPQGGNLLADIRTGVKLKHVEINANQKPIAQQDKLIAMAQEHINNMSNNNDDDDDDININNNDDGDWDDSDYQNELQKRFQPKPADISNDTKPIQEESKTMEAQNANIQPQNMPVEKPNINQNNIPQPPPPPPAMPAGGIPPPPPLNIPQQDARSVPQPTAQPVARPNMSNVFEEIKAKEAQRMENPVPTPSENTIINLNELPQMSNLTPAVAGWERNGNPEEYTLDFLNKLNQNKKTEVNPKMIEWLNEFIEDNELDMKTDNLSQDNIKTLKEALAAQIAENEDDD